MFHKAIQSCIDSLNGPMSSGNSELHCLWDYETIFLGVDRWGEGKYLQFHSWPAGGKLGSDPIDKLGLNKTLEQNSNISERRQREACAFWLFLNQLYREERML